MFDISYDALDKIKHSARLVNWVQYLPTVKQGFHTGIAPMTFIFPYAGGVMPIWPGWTTSTLRHHCRRQSTNNRPTEH